MALIECWLRDGICRCKCSYAVPTRLPDGGPEGSGSEIAGGADVDAGAATGRASVPR